MDHWRRICGLHCTEGRSHAVWLAHNPDDDVVHAYDACSFDEHCELVVIAEGLNARGRHIPIAWVDKSMSKALLERGCNMLYEPTDDTDQMTEIVASEMLTRLRTGRFKVEKRLKKWIEEFQGFNRENGKVPVDSHPLMTATRYAIAEIKYARAIGAAHKKLPARKFATI